MARRLIIAPGEYVHIYNRGTDGRSIFMDDLDKNRFLFALYLANGTLPFDIREQQIDLLKIFTVERGEQLVDICAYCLMPNHFHLCLREKTYGGVSRFMQKLGTAYTGYFNARHNRSGVLFQGKYKMKHEQTDVKLSYLISYIHLNPVKLIEPAWKDTGIKNRSAAEKYLEKYIYSSYLDYLKEGRPQASLLEKGALPKYCETPGDFKKEIGIWLTYKDERPL